MARTRGAKSSSPSSRKQSLRKEPIPDPASEPSQPRAVPPPVKPARKPPARRYLTRSGGRPLQKRPRVESSEPIDLTEQSPELSPVPSPVSSPVSSPVPSARPSPLRAVLRHSRILIAARACTVIQPVEEIPYGAPTDSERLFLPKGSHGFLSIHDNQPALLYFEEKIHKRSFRELIPFPPLSKAALPNSGALGLIELISLSAHNQLQGEHPRHIPEGITVAAPAIPRSPPVAPTSSQPSTFN
ncbi:hypothetical protein CK203_109055 [Vitis vinifera]|uniref:Uncharacterized protein n=1 Tax=Vitis vinifera TaxID=29760 RepID=A0A438C5H0_VITVI|nr:hypothetical protein CK203_109055 [Vitis vinifera]